MRKNAIAAAAVIALGASSFLTVWSMAPREHAQATALPVEHVSPAARDHTPAVYNATGAASWYGSNLAGRRDARGETFDPNAMTAAHRTLPLNSLITVTNLENGRSVVVRVTDRGPFAHRRLIDLSHAAAEALGYTQQGTARVTVRALSPD